ncbi:MAG: NDP-sugar synthase [Deltaproteobacteria bacterium]|nr:MAG: NDP-sugar synthase [Deltaproteobacteria bacterium]
MILCAGLGTRLGPLGKAYPKPLLPMCDVPIVRYGIALLVGHGIRDIVINTHYQPERFLAALGDGTEFGARIRYSHEPELLGTGGGVKRALPLLDPDGADEPFFVVNGKLVVDADLHGLMAAHRAAGDVLATLLVRRVPDAADWGALDVGPDGRLRDVFAGGEHMFCGVHVARPSVIARLPDGEACSIRQGYLPWLRAGAGAIATFEHAGYFAEHSTPERYVQGNIDLARGARLRFPPAPTTGVDPGADVHPTAEVVPPVRIGPGARVGAGARVGPDAVVCPGGIVPAGARVTRAVVWPAAPGEPPPPPIALP